MAVADKASIHRRLHTNNDGEDLSLQLHISNTRIGYHTDLPSTVSDGIDRPAHAALPIQHLPPFFGLHSGAKTYFTSPLFVAYFVRIMHAEYSRE